MLTAEHDGGQRKSHPYWDGQYGTYSVTVQTSNKIILRGIGTDTEPLYVLEREILVTRFHESRTISQVHYSSWPDFGVPAEPKDLLRLVEICGEVEGSHDSKGPLLVHCSAGCGRTGTFCTVDSVIAILNARFKDEYGSHMSRFRDDETTKDLIARTVEDFRHQRLSMVQTLRQYVLCYETVLAWFEKHIRADSSIGETLWPGSPNSPRRF